MAELTRAIAQLMQERERSQQSGATLSDPPRLAEVIDLVRSRVAPGERSLAEALTRQFLEKSGAELLNQLPTDQLSALCVSLFHFVAERSPEEPRVAVHTAPDGVGWDGFVLQTLLRDRPFIVDTVKQALQDARCGVRRLLHPVFTVERDSRGTLLAVSPPADVGRQESVLYVELDRVRDPEAVASLVTERLTDVVAATDDYQSMRNRAEELADELRNGTLPRPWNADVEEIAAFLDWLGQKNFVFLGYREYRFSTEGGERSAIVKEGSGLGVLRRERRSTYATGQPLGDVLRRRLSEAPLYMFSKTNAVSPIHRRDHMEYIGIKEVDPQGIVTGERRFIGLFTQNAYAQEPMAIPLLRQKLASILEREGASEGSHDYRQITRAFNSMPRIELLALPSDSLQLTIKAILGATGSNDARVTIQADPLERGAFVLVTLPRQRFSNELQQQIEARLQDVLLARPPLESRLVLDDSDQTRVHFYFVPAADSLRPVPADELRHQLGSLLRTWEDRLLETLLAAYPREQAKTLAATYAKAFPPPYKVATDTPLALADIRQLESLRQSRQAQIDIVNPPAVVAGEERFTVVKLYLAGEELVLSDFLPVLENLGLRVFAEDAVEASLPEVGAARIHSFFVQDLSGKRLDLETVRVPLGTALLHLYRGRLDNDRLNSLIVTAGLEWRQVDLLRTYVHHAVQLGVSPSRSAISQALCNHPNVAQEMWRYFDAKFNPLDPAAPRDRLKWRLQEGETRLLTLIETVESTMEDRILRGLLASILATVRTNYYHPPSEATGAIAIKLDCRLLPHLPPPQPIFEIFAHALDVDGLHLRGGTVARGGIRLSDRADDFRTEILGLMNTQMVKNAVIVPAGAKGGFIVRRSGSGAAAATQVVAAYRTFIGALLDVTDNVVHGRVESPVGVLIYDDLDPYLVVAADKGTSSFSDIANEIAQQRQFWLDDAFASGGSNGYDHKKVAITARGAWECVRRHLRDMGRDPERDPITAIGVGDMSGDVFGNGMLLSRQLRLLAAFNHQHIFVDPTPDAARSFAERERLFHLPRSTWADYNLQYLSEGGGIFQRSAKRVHLSAAARAMLGLDFEGPTGEEVVRAILKMRVDLLWNGGIGTYVKASDEAHIAVGDSTNDAVRIDATELRVAIVAEGGNLGLTQRARVEYALAGGRINTDAIDNSAGVDMSDHEVNLKIALAPLLESRVLSSSERNGLLAEVQDDVALRVLSHNQSQSYVLGLDQVRSQTRLSEFRDHMQQLEADGALVRRADALPDRETLRNRRGQFQGLTRPELAVVLAHTKLALQKQLLSSPLPDDTFLERYLRGYFPEVFNARWGQAVRSHRLRREIIAVEIANHLIDTMGMTFAARTRRDIGCDAATIVRAWNIVISVCDALPLWEAIATATPALPLAAETRCMFLWENAVERATKWFIETQPNDVPMAEMVEALVISTEDLLAVFGDIMPRQARSKADVLVDSLAADGTPRALAQRVVTIAYLCDIFEIAELAAGTDVPRRTVAEVFYRCNEVIDLDWIADGLSRVAIDERWERRAAEELHQSLVNVRRQLTTDLLGYRDSAGEVEFCVETYTNDHDAAVTKTRRLLDDMKGARQPTLAMLIVAVREAGRLVGHVA